MERTRRPKIDGESFVVIRQASETGQLFGSVTMPDIGGAPCSPPPRAKRV